MPPVSIMIKPASGLCNMKCDYCFYCDEMHKRTQDSYGIMTRETLKNVIRKSVLGAEGFCTIAFQGGEPTLAGIDFFEEAVHLAQHYNKNKIRIEYALQTNGYALTEKWCRFFKQHHFLVGLSVDGTKSIHDRYRRSKDGMPTYERILHSAELLSEYQIDFNILTVVHKETAKEIKTIYKEYRKRNWNYLQFITCLDPLKQTRGKEDYSLTPEAYGQFLTDLFELWYQDYQRGEQPYIRQFENYISILLGYPPESCEQRGVCGIQNVIEADGSVYPCDFYVLDQYCLGNLNRHSRKEIEDKRSKIGFMEQSFIHPAKCRECKWFSLCRGGCFRSRIETGQDREGINYFCKGYQLFFETCFERLRQIAAEIYEAGNK